MENNKGFFTDDILDNGPFYHGTKADLKIGDCLLPGLNPIIIPK
jgi:rifampin ADP-ribosylating transferase